ncbi:MAG: sigma 54-interacting transcriptional regulator, partial [Clostridiales bacterium]|nr:sigma 54-interacting transcriptional regulator [Clostridiales bacterium]
MNNYIQEILRIIRTKNDGMVQSVMIFNKEGILEYYKKGDENLGNFADEVVGKSICDIYENLNETNSTVVKALQMGESSVTNEQRLVYRDFDLIISGTTCPIRDETGDIQGAADIARTVKVQKQRECSDVCLESDALNRIVTGDDGMVRLKKRISEIAKSDSAVFLYGETGTGKELFAEALHDLGKRRDRPFVTQNCAAIPGSLLESIFFGTEKGSFTGAERKAGLFELADGGTLFLDEVNSMPLDIQAKLLKVIEEQRVRRIGGEKDISFDVRVVAASNEAPSALIDSGRMRSDFYYRIAVVNLTIPPLRERADDLDLLTKYYIDYF